MSNLVLASFYQNQSFVEDDGVPLPIKLQFPTQPLGIVHVRGGSGRDLMGQPLVYSQRFSSFLRNCPGEPWSWMDKNEAIQLVQTFALIYLSWNFRLGLSTWAKLFGWDLFMPSSLRLVLLISHLGSCKMNNNDTHFHRSLTLLDFYGQQIFNVFGALIDICNEPLNNDL